MASVLVIGSSPAAALAAALGTERHARLRSALLARAIAWARAAAAGGTVVIEQEPGDALHDAAVGLELITARGGHSGERLAHASEAVLRAHGGPLLIVAVDVPSLADAHAVAALGDLRGGCDLSIGPATAGGYYLLALSEPQPDLFALEPSAFEDPALLGLTLAAAQRGGLRVGMLRSERALQTAADISALLADPTAPADIVAALA